MLRRIDPLALSHTHFEGIPCALAMRADSALFRGLLIRCRPISGTSPPAGGPYSGSVAFGP
jgi:hypothetical protein